MCHERVVEFLKDFIDVLALHRELCKFWALRCLGKPSSYLRIVYSGSEVMPKRCGRKAEPGGDSRLAGRVWRQVVHLAAVIFHSSRVLAEKREPVSCLTSVES